MSTTAQSEPHVALTIVHARCQGLINLALPRVASEGHDNVAFECAGCFGSTDLAERSEAVHHCGRVSACCSSKGRQAGDRVAYAG